MMDELTKRAFAAYFRAGGDDQPSNASGLVELGGKRYVVLRSGASILAVYRVRNDGILKRMVRWPAQLCFMTHARISSTLSLITLIAVLAGCGRTECPTSAVDVRTGQLIVMLCDDALECCPGQGCVNTDLDPRNCGGCGIVCDDYTYCAAGVCRPIGHAQQGPVCQDLGTSTDLPSDL